MRTITLADGKERPILFDFNVVAEVQDEYGDISLLPEKMKNLKGLRWVLMLAINEGIAKKNHDIGTTDQPLTEFEVGLIIPLTKDKLQEITESIMKAFFDGMGGKKNVLEVAEQAGVTLPNLTEEAVTKAL